MADPKNTNDSSLFRSLVDQYSEPLYWHVRNLVCSHEDADDIVQTVFADLARNLPTFEYDRAKGRFRSYLTGLVNWRVMDRLKASKRDAELKANFWEEAKAAGGDDDFSEREWQTAAMEEALRRMKPSVSPEHYAAFVASAVEGQDTDVVTKLYGISRDSLYQIRKRLTVKLREKLAEVRAEMDAPDARHPRPGLRPLRA